MSKQSITPYEPKTRKSRRQNPYMLSVIIPVKDERLGGRDSYLILQDIMPEQEAAGPETPPIPNTFPTTADAVAAAALIPQFCTEHEVHIVQVSPRIVVNTRTKTTVKLGE